MDGTENHLVEELMYQQQRANEPQIVHNAPPIEDPVLISSISSTNELLDTNRNPDLTMEAPEYDVVESTLSAAAEEERVPNPEQQGAIEQPTPSEPIVKQQEQDTNVTNEEQEIPPETQKQPQATAAKSTNQVGVGKDTTADDSTLVYQQDAAYGTIKQHQQVSIEPAMLAPLPPAKQQEAKVTPAPSVKQQEAKAAPPPSIQQQAAKVTSSSISQVTPAIGLELSRMPVNKIASNNDRLGPSSSDKGKKPSTIPTSGPAPRRQQEKPPSEQMPNIPAGGPPPRPTPNLPAKADQPRPPPSKPSLPPGTDLEALGRIGVFGEVSSSAVHPSAMPSLHILFIGLLSIWFILVAKRS